MASVPAQAQSVVATVILGGQPKDLAVDPVTNKIYVSITNPDLSGSVAVVDGEYNTDSIFAAGMEPLGIAVNSVTNTIFVADSGVNNLTVLDGATDVTSSLATGIGPVAIAVNPVANTIAVMNQGHSADYGTVTVVNMATNEATTVYPGSRLTKIAANTVTNTYYVIFIHDQYSTLTAIDGATLAISPVEVGADPVDLAVNPVTNTIYVAVTGYDGTVAVVNGSTNEVSSINTGASPIAIAVNPVTNKVYVLNNDAFGTVTVIDGSTNVATSAVATGALPVGIVVDPVSNKIYVINDDDYGSVTQIDGATNATSSILLQSNPVAIAVNPVTGRVYVLNNDAKGTLTVIDGANPVVAPSIAGAPRSQTVNAGAPVVLSVSATGTPPLTYQWSLNGASLSDGSGVSGSSAPTLYISAGTTQANAGAYTCEVTNGAGSATSPAATLTVVNSPTPGRLIDISARASVGAGADILVAGFTVSGQGSKTLLLRGVGPTLARFGVEPVLSAPTLSLYDGASPANLITTDSGWQNAPSAPAAPWSGEAFPVDATSADFSQVGAFALTPGSADSAVKVTLPAGGYTSQVAGASPMPGIALAEVYDADTGFPSAQLANISARAGIGSGGNSLIAGFVISGSTSQTILIRASGPALDALGVPFSAYDVEVQLLDSNQNVLASNSGWGGNPQIALAASSVGAFSWSNPSSDDSALLLTLPPGAYTARVSTLSPLGGLALIEVYAVP